MKHIEQKPVVLYQYENDQDRLFFESQFSRDFTIVFTESEDDFLQQLKINLDICCVFLDKNDLQSVLSSVIFGSLGMQVLNCPVFLVGHDIRIETIAQLLKAGSISKCYGKPYDANLIRSDVFAAKMNLKPLSPTVSAERFEASKMSSLSARSMPKIPSVLIVDDEGLATKYLAKQLTQLNRDVPILLAENATEAMVKLDASGRDIAVVISDQRMPGIKGNQLLNEIHKSFPHVIRILTSAYQEVDVALGAINEGRIFRYLKKPWDAVEINELILEALKEHQRLCTDLVNSQNTLTEDHDAVLERRIAKLRSAFSEDIKRVTGSDTLEKFITFLRSMDPGRVQAANLRANKETDIETKLISEFSKRIQSWLQELSDLGTVGVSERQRLAIGIVKQIQYPSDDFNKTNKEMNKSDAAFQAIINQSVAALDVLLMGSNLSRSALNILPPKSNASYKVKEALDRSEVPSLKMYKHFLSPLSNVSKTLIDSQAALLFLFILEEVLGSLIEIRSSNGEFQITLRSDSVVAKVD